MVSPTGGIYIIAPIDAYLYIRRTKHFNAALSQKVCGRVKSNP